MSRFYILSFALCGIIPTNADDTSLTAVRQRMEYWREDFFWPEARLFQAAPPTNRKMREPNGRYLLFGFDSGGLNNIRIGWEMAALAAVESNRTLVWPPQQLLYLLGAEPSGIEYFLNVKRLQSGLDAIPLAEFLRREQRHLDLPISLGNWAASEAADIKFPESDWKLFSKGHIKGVGADDRVVCDMASYRVQERILYTGPTHDSGRIFSCGNWPNVGEPRFTDGRQVWPVPKWGFQLLRNHFVWHHDAFDIASRVVAHLGIFNYVALHARYGDFQFQEQKSPAETLLKTGWLSLLQAISRHGQHRSLRSDISTHVTRGKQDAGEVRRWLLEGQGRSVYIATDQTSADYFAAFHEAGLKTVSWHGLLDDARAGRGPLAHVLKSYSPERLANLAGVVEQLICTYGRVFIGSEKSTFTGYIERMRLYAGAPTHATYIKYEGISASDKGLRLLHGDPIDKRVQARVKHEMEDWDARGGSLDRDDVGELPQDAF